MKNSVHISRFHRFLLRIGGINPESYLLCPYDEQQKLLCSGLFVLIPTVLALFAGWFAFGYLTENMIARVIASIILASLIFIIDRSILIFPASGSTFLLRVSFAFCLSVVFAEPIVLRVFEDKIVATEKIEIRDRQKAIKKEYEGRIETLKTEKDSIYEYRKQLAHIVVEETNGNGSGKSGYGKVANMKKELQNSYIAESDARLDKINQKMDSLSNTSLKLQEEAKEEVAMGLLGKLQTLHKLSHEHSSIWWFSWLLHLILIFFDTLPLMLKFSTADKVDKSLYHYQEKSIQEACRRAINMQEEAIAQKHFDKAQKIVSELKKSKNQKRKSDIERQKRFKRYAEDYSLEQAILNS